MYIWEPPVLPWLPFRNLWRTDLNVVAVITAPDRPAGRGKKIRFSAVKDYALSQDLTILQPENLKDPDLLAQLTRSGPRPAGGGCLSHAARSGLEHSLAWAPSTCMPPCCPSTGERHPSIMLIINGETRTGVTTFLIDDKIDTGNILLQEEIAIGEDETAGELHDRLMELGADAGSENRETAC